MAQSSTKAGRASAQSSSAASGSTQSQSTSGRGASSRSASGSRSRRASSGRSTGRSASSRSASGSTSSRSASGRGTSSASQKTSSTLVGQAGELLRSARKPLRSAVSEVQKLPTWALVAIGVGIVGAIGWASGLGRLAGIGSDSSSLDEPDFGY